MVGALVALRRIEYTDIGRLAFVSLLLLVAGTLNVSNFSIYRLFLHVPGIDSIRAVTRVMLVMVVPLGILAGIGSSVFSRFLSDAVPFVFALEVCWRSFFWLQSQVP
ncbi:hypothetical protein VM57_02140 [Stenotrophomonas maltophilia]|uniref:Uncharacterized protein n=1 Tax=Stenotrophomonas maltophilia TaxID=40324 RepID=A0A0F5ZPN6_STEMA|nr:hypothetical protein VM57_02140 [Stenotrophomonas maltophilia]